ncbi:hypothetical protein ACFSO7_23655 [Bacillus sp. CGMCC 1.16607]|uniref:hypothetical protein n=1 Tax=Bacillus sp. CGMCC 1.16607 TaxID=3351842 RepID=UPI003638FE80
MTLFFYAILNVLAMYLFIKKKKSLHILEILVYWMIASYLYQNFSALCYMNFKRIIVPQQLSLEFAHFLNRIVLFPIVLVTFLHYFQIGRNLFKRFFIIILSVFFLVGLEWLSDLFGVIKHVHWKLWWSFSFWLATQLILIGFMKFFQKILYRGGWNI